MKIKELTNSDLQIYFNCSKNTATQRKKEIIKALGLPDKKRLHLLNLAKYEGVTVAEIEQILNN